MSGTTGLDVTQVVGAANAGDAIAFARIVDAYDDDLVRVAYVITRDVDLAHEAVQDAWSIAWRRLGSLRDPERLRPWLVAIAANAARQVLRRRRHLVREIDIATVGAWAPAGWDEGHDRRIDLRRALDALTPEERSLIAMRYVLRMTSEEIGGAIGLTGAGVRSRLMRVLARLREDLGDA